jgi:hypothetical protein
MDLYPGNQIVQRGGMHTSGNPDETEPPKFMAVVFPTKEFSVDK